MDEKKLQDQLDELKTNLETAVTEKAKKEFQSQIKSLEDKIASIDLKKVNDDISGINTSVTETKTAVNEVKTAVKEINDARVISEERAKKSEDAIDKLLSESKNNSRNGKGKIITLADAITDSMNEGENHKNIEMLAMNHKDRIKRFSFDLKLAGDITTGNVTGGSRYGQVLAPGIIENPKRKVHVRSLVPVGTAGPGNTYTFMAENGTGEGLIAPTAETGDKPQFDLDLIEKTVNFETIAGWLKVTRKAMNNIPGFLSYLNSRLPELLLRAEDLQLIAGDGNTPNISGITDAGNYTAATSSATVLIEKLIDAIAQLEDDEERYATGILLRPVDYYGFFKNKATGSGEYDLPQNVTFINGVLYISGIPAFASTAMTAGSYIVGDWEMGAQLLIQEGMRIEFFEQDGDNVKKNKITVRIEETVAFPIYGDNYFIVGTVPDAAS